MEDRILKLTKLEPKQAQRAVDFVTGGTYITGRTEWIGEQTFCLPQVCSGQYSRTTVIFLHSRC